MTREYVRTHVGLMDDTDYMGLSPLGIAAWHTVNMLQGAQTEEAFKDRPQIVALLRRHGFGDQAPAAMAELEGAGWIKDHPDRPVVELKGFRRWQASKRNQYMRDYRAEQSRNSNVTDRNSNERARAESSPVPYRTVPSHNVPSRPPADAGGPGVEEARQVLARVMEGIKDRE